MGNAHSLYSFTADTHGAALAIGKDKRPPKLVILVYAASGRTGTHYLLDGKSKRYDLCLIHGAGRRGCRAVAAHSAGHTGNRVLPDSDADHSASKSAITGTASARNDSDRDFC